MTLGLSNVQIFVLGSPIPFLSLTLTVTLALTLCSAKIKNTCSTLLGITISLTVLGCEVHWYNTVLDLVKVLRFHCDFNVGHCSSPR